MAFFSYNLESRSRFDRSTQTQLNSLLDEFGAVELNEVDSDQWCVRVTATGPDGEAYPLAAIGKSPSIAAQRLLRMIQIRESAH